MDWITSYSKWRGSRASWQWRRGNPHHLRWKQTSLPRRRGTLTLKPDKTAQLRRPNARISRLQLQVRSSLSGLKDRHPASRQSSGGDIPAIIARHHTTDLLQTSVHLVDDVELWKCREDRNGVSAWVKLRTVGRDIAVRSIQVSGGIIGASVAVCLRFGCGRVYKQLCRTVYAPCRHVRGQG